MIPATTLGQPLIVAGQVLTPVELARVPDVAGAWLLVLLPAGPGAIEMPDRIKALRHLETTELLEAAQAALSVLSSRFREPRQESFYFANRALGELDSIVQLQRPAPSRLEDPPC